MKKYQFYCDMDGVLCNFIDAATNIVNEALEQREKYQLVEPEFYKIILSGNEEFWANLEWNKGGQVIWAAIKDQNPYILSAPMGKSKESMAGKRRWIEKNLGVPPERIILDDDKYKYTMLDDRQGVLIDDMWYNVKPYRKHGGEAIYHNNMRTTMGLIKRYAE